MGKNDKLTFQNYPDTMFQFCSVFLILCGDGLLKPFSTLNIKQCCILCLKPSHSLADLIRVKLIIAFYILQHNF